MHTLLLADRYSVADRTTCPPPSIPPESLAELLDTVSRRMVSGGVLMLSHPWDAYLQDIPIPHNHAGDTAINVQVGERWKARTVPGDAWIRWTRDDTGHTLWTAAIDQETPRGRSTPLIDDVPVVTASNMAIWREITGQTWIGTPGMTGCAMLRDHYPEGAHQPYWAPKTPWTYGDIETDYGPRQWSRQPDGTMEFGYDLNKAYLAALKGAELPVDKLEPRPDLKEFDRSLGGIWRVDMAPWTDPNLPDPAGYGHVLPDGTRWLTTPTLHLVTQLTDAGRHGGFAVREARVAKSARVTRGWAEKVQKVIACTDMPDIARAAKRVYAETYGMWRRDTGRITRADWHYTIIALARCNLWRKIDQFAQCSGRYPHRIETDALFYAGGDDDTWDSLVPAGMIVDKNGVQLGAFKPLHGGVGKVITPEFS